jgi:hypothetical protein
MLPLVLMEVLAPVENLVVVMVVVEVGEAILEEQMVEMGEFPVEGEEVLEVVMVEIHP